MGEGGRPLPEEPLRRYFELLPQAVLVLDLGDRVRYANPAARRLLETPETPLEGLPLEEACPSLWHQMRGPSPLPPPGEAGMPVVVDRPGISPRAYLAVEDPLGDGRGRVLWLLAASAAQTLVRDYDRIRNQFLVLTESSNDVIFVLERDLSVSYVNPAFRTVTGHEPGDFLGRTLNPSDFLPPDEIRRFRLLGTARILREGIQNKLVRVQKKSGAFFWSLLTFAPSRFPGRPPTYLGILRDVSEFYRTREQLQKQHSELKRTVARLEDSTRLQEQFLANVTHELRTPLTAILIAAEALQAHSEALGPAPKRHLALLHRNARQLLETINDLLDLAKLKRGGFEVKEREVDLRAFLQGLAEETEPLFHQKGLSLALEVSSDLPPTLWTDPDLLRRILVNLLGNAAKFTRQGGAVLKVSTREGRLSLQLSDTGPGIPPQELSRVFEEFRQADGSDSRRYAGTGLGLSIADRCARLLDGTIEVESALGKGSTFTVVLPLRQFPSALPGPEG
ncbi:MAG: ATP-binding protein [Acidobacteriota bacterium]